MNKRTTVIVLGDARNNYNLPHEWVLRDVQQRAKQVIWLNPENRMTWGFGDSEMDRYAPYCDDGRGVPQPESALPGHRPPGHA